MNRSKSFAFALVLLAALAPTPTQAQNPSPDPSTSTIPYDATVTSDTTAHGNRKVEYTLSNGDKATLLITGSGHKETTTTDPAGVLKAIETIDDTPNPEESNSVRRKITRVT